MYERIKNNMEGKRIIFMDESGGGAEGKEENELKNMQSLLQKKGDNA